MSDSENILLQIKDIWMGIEYGRIQFTIRRLFNSHERIKIYVAFEMHVPYKER